jgi:hypothetical protein
MKARSARFLAPALLAIALAFALAACIQIEVESEFESDGSGTHSLTSTIDRSIMGDEMLAGELEGEIDFDEARRQGEEAGFEVEEIDTADRIGIRLTTSVEDNSDLGEVLNQLFAASSGEGPPVDGFSGGFSESGGFGGSTYRFELTVDGDALFEEEFDDEVEDELDDEFGMDFGPEIMRQFLDLTYTVSMPGEITEHNGRELGAGRVQWDIPFQGVETFYAESEEGSTFSLALIIAIGVGVLALALIIVGGIVLMRPKKTPEHPAESSGAPE